MAWYDKHRKCQDGTSHEGRLELITWEGKAAGGEVLGWGACVLDEADDLRRTFEVEHSGSEAAFFGYWPQGFRWTCCGCTGDMEWGCDHHGTGSQPCQCDFCHMGKPLPDSLYKQNEQATRGLRLSRGPDPRSYNPMQAALAEVGRGMFDMDMPESDAGSSAPAGPPAPFPDVLNKVQMLTSLFSQSPSMAAKFAETKARLEAEERSNGASSSSSERGTGSSGGACSSRKAGTSSKAGSSSSKSVKTWVCANCGVERPKPQMKCCSGCKAVQKVPYCGQECQHAHWPKHRKACKQAQAAATAAAAGSSKAVPIGDVD